MTVSPILREQIFHDGGAEYSEYVSASRAVAKKLGIPLCDANKIMKTCLAGMTEPDARA